MYGSSACKHVKVDWDMQAFGYYINYNITGCAQTIIPAILTDGHSAHVTPALFMLYYQTLGLYELRNTKIEYTSMMETA